MASDSIANASAIPISSSNPKDFAKKKRANRSAKLKQCKLDARREQWLSQVRNKGSKEVVNGGGGSRGEPVLERKERGRSVEKLEIKQRGQEENEGLMNNYSDSESTANSPTSHSSSVLGSNDSGTNFTGSSSSSSSRSSSSSSSRGCCSGSVSEEDEEGDDGCLDDWEAVADALAASNEKQEHQNDNSNLPRNSCEDVAGSDSLSEVNSRPATGPNIVNQELDSGLAIQRDSAPNCRAWRPDDAFRPQGLPNLSKQFSFPMNKNRHFGCGRSVWGCNVVSAPISCPICCEDLDFTDSSFIPCSCGFSLCLFCHKRILEGDARCPGCRKMYNNDPIKEEAAAGGSSLTLARSCSMVSRS